MSLGKIITCELRHTFKPEDVTPAMRHLAEGTHLYIISRTPRVTIPAKGVRFHRFLRRRPFFTGAIEVAGTAPLEIPFRIAAPSRKSRWVSNETDDHCGIAVDGAPGLYGDAAVMASYVTGGDRRLGLHEVLYVGRSRGHLTERFALDRLEVHETGQEILEREKNPHFDVYWSVLDICGSTNIGILGSAASAAVFGRVDLPEVLSQALSEPEQIEKRTIDLAEAALIRHFQPAYNCHHKGTFPNARNNTARPLHAGGFSDMSLVLKTGGTGIRFFSAGVTPKAVHWAAFRVIERREKRVAEYELASGELESTLRTVVDRLAAEAEQEPTRWLVVQRRELPR